MIWKIIINQGAVTVNIHIFLINALSKIKIKKNIRKHPLINATLITIVTDVTAGNQIRASYVNRGIISLHIVQNRTL